MFCVAGVMVGKLVDTVKNVSLHWGGGRGGTCCIVTSEAWHTVVSNYKQT